MLSKRKTFRPIAALTFVVLCGAAAHAQDDNYVNPYDRYNGGGVRGVSSDHDFEILVDPSRSVAPLAIQDPVFATYVNISLIPTAIASQDASLLVDVALQLAEGERVLLREHSTGITSAGLLTKAVRAATEIGDEQALTRLNQVADSTGNKDLKALLQTSKLVSKSRGVDPDLVIDPAQVDTQAYAAIQLFQSDINVATFSGDAPMLQDLKARLKDVVLPPQVAKSLDERIDRALASCGEEPTSTDIALAKLNADSRGWFKDATGLTTPEPIRKIAPDGISIGGRTDSGSHLAVYTPASIDRDGNIWSGSSNSGSSSRIVGRATARFRGNECWWYANYGDAVSPVRAYPKYDKSGGTSAGPRPVSKDSQGRPIYICTLQNDSGRPLVYKLPNGKVGNIAPGSFESIPFVGPTYDGTFQVVSTGNRYKIRAGRYTMYWHSGEGRVAARFSE